MKKVEMWYLGWMSKRYDLSQPWNDESRCYSEALGEESLRYFDRLNMTNNRNEAKA
jgi:hypothetical protein